MWGALAGATALQLCLLLFGGGRLQVYWPGPRLADTEPLLNEEAWPPPLPPPGSRHFGAAATSRFWGEAGEAWHPAGPFMDFSYAGGWGEGRADPRWWSHEVRQGQGRMRAGVPVRAGAGDEGRAV